MVQNVQEEKPMASLGKSFRMRIVGVVLLLMLRPCMIILGVALLNSSVSPHQFSSIADTASAVQVVKSRIPHAVAEAKGHGRSLSVIAPPATILALSNSSIVADYEAAPTIVSGSVSIRIPRAPPV
jgi:hypothetical protein